MGSDLACMVRRPDVNYIFYKQGAGGNTQPGNDAMFFYSEAPGTSATSTTAFTGSASTMALVGYRINQYNQYYPKTPVMERLGENLTWGGLPDTAGVANPGGMVFLPTTLAGNWTYTLGTPPYNTSAAVNQADTTHYQVLSDMAFRMEVCFLVKGGTYALSGTTAVSGTTGYSNAPTAIAPTVPRPYLTTHYFAGGDAPDLAGNVYGFPPDLGGVVVTIAVLDNTSRKIITGSQLTTLSSALGDSLSGNATVGNVQPTPVLTAQAWQNQISQTGFAQTVNIPQRVLSQVRIYERTFYLDEN
jgi:hypothetical protein